MLRNCKVSRALPRIVDSAKNDRSAILRARYDSSLTKFLSLVFLLYFVFFIFMFIVMLVLSELGVASMHF